MTEPAEQTPIEIKKQTRIRDAKIYDIPTLESLMYDFLRHQTSLGNKIYATNELHLRGGITIQLGIGYSDPRWKIIVAERDNRITGFLIGILEPCAATEKYVSCVRIHADYMLDDSMNRGRILKKMWQELEKWGRKNGAGYFHGFIHPGNQPSIRAAKEVNFKHHTTQFLKVVEEET